MAPIGRAKPYGRYGYRKIAELLGVEGWKVNRKKVERLWREEGLQLPPNAPRGGNGSIATITRLSV
ncbi:MAG: transposase [Rhodobacteraceae bacterium]|nr:transposase [Paracoccaceae bacterium]